MLWPDIWHTVIVGVTKTPVIWRCVLWFWSFVVRMMVVESFQQCNKNRAANRRSMFEYDTYIFSHEYLAVNIRIHYLFLSTTKRGIDDEPKQLHHRRTAKNSFMVHFDSAHLPHWPEIWQAMWRLAHGECIYIRPLINFLLIELLLIERELKGFYFTMLGHRYRSTARVEHICSLLFSLMPFTLVDLDTRLVSALTDHRCIDTSVVARIYPFARITGMSERKCCLFVNQHPTRSCTST